MILYQLNSNLNPPHCKIALIKKPHNLFTKSFCPRLQATGRRRHQPVFPSSVHRSSWKIRIWAWLSWTRVLGVERCFLVLGAIDWVDRRISSAWPAVIGRARFQDVEVSAKVDKRIPISSSQSFFREAQLGRETMRWEKKLHKQKERDWLKQ